MHISLLVLFVAAVVCAAGDPPAPQVRWFNQTLDHFADKPDGRTFQERFLVYDKFYKGSGPIFFCPGGESDVMAGYNHNGLMFEFGERVGALLLFPEHRYYGQTLPFGPVDSYTREHVGFLTIEQALADYITVLRAVRAEYKVLSTTPVIAFGGSYPGELAAFLRFAYPDDVDGSLAASAPVRYHQGLQPPVPAGSFFKIVTDTFANTDPTCPTLVRRAFVRIDSLAATLAGRAVVTKALRLCTPLADGADALHMLALWIENAFALLGMINYPYATGGFVAHPLAASCEAMRQGGGSAESLLSDLADAVGIAYNNTGDLTCFNITDEYYPCADITGCGGGVGDPDALSWDYQSCTQIVSNVDTNNVTDMFPSAPYSFDAIVAYCQRTWGTTPDPLAIPRRFNITAETASRIIFSNGLLDPWWPGGILERLSDTLIPILIADAAHHLDLRGTMPDDPPAVTAARTLEVSIISDWLAAAAAERAARAA